MTGSPTRTFARQAGVSRQAVERALRRGRLVRGVDGHLDVTDPVNEAFIALHRPGAKSAGNLKTQIAMLQSKAELLQIQAEKLENSHTDRAALTEACRQAARRLLEAWLPGIPYRHSAKLARVMGCPEETAYALLVRFTELVLHEARDCELEAVTALRMVP